MREVSTASIAARIAGLGLATTWSATAAFAICGTPMVGGGASGPPSISVTEASTTQVLEEIRKRAEAAREQPVLASNTTEAAPAVTPAEAAPPAAAEAQPEPPASAASQDTAGGSPGGGGAAASKPSKPSAPSGGGYSGQPASLKDSYGVTEERSTYGGVTRTRGAWIQGYAAYEKHDDLAPGNQENPDRRSRTVGAASGVDWTIARGTSAYQFGVFSGYSHTDSEFSDTTFTSAETDGTSADYARSNSEQEVKGPFIGAYAAAVRGQWTHDIAFKVDFFDLSASSTLTQTCGNFENGNDGELSDIGQQSGSADMTTFTLAAGTEYRHELTAHSWIAPAFGIRYMNTAYSNDRSSATFTDSPVNDSRGSAQPGTLGLDDGYAIRLQGGLRYGQDRRTPEGYLWTTTVGAFLYSDVVVHGFVGVAGQTGEIVSPVDEGKVRALGAVTSNLDMGNGWSYQMVGEVRGGEDLFGIGGQVGIRYEW